MKETWIIENKYEVISKIKQGGFGIVYYGFDRKFDKPVAIKAIEPSLLKEAKYIDMFLEEAKNAAKLNHNNIVRVYDLIKTDDGKFYIVMEYVDGVDLGRLLKKAVAGDAKIPQHLGIYIVKEVCKALEYAHNKRDIITNRPVNIVHQDISPSNVMIGFDGKVKLIDFGTAKVRRHFGGDKNEIVLTGKLPYMSPEQLNGATIDKRSDIFALGSVFYEVLTSERLFDFDDDKKTVEAIKKSKYDKKVIEKNGIPDNIQKVLAKSLKKDPEDRYQGVNEIYIDLVEYLMSTVNSVELSEDLGQFIRDLFAEEIAQKEGGDAVEQVTAHAEPSAADVTSVKEDVIEEEVDDVIAKTAPEEEVREVETEEPVMTAEAESETAKDTKFGLKDIRSALESGFGPDETAEQEAPEKGDNGSERKDKAIAPAVISSLEEDEVGEDDVKTVYDVIRISTKAHKKPLIMGALGVLAAFFIFSVLNIAFRWTESGSRMYDYLFPPAIRIYTAPQGATVALDDEIISGKTPMTIPKISPGVHKLTLSYPGLPPLIKSIRVPSKGSVEVAGEKTRKGYEPYLFRFRSKLILNSDPIGSTVYLNDLKLNQKTPTSAEWEVGMPLEIRMSKPGLAEISGIEVNLLEESAAIEDNRIWNFAVSEDEIRTYTIEGMFRKPVAISTLPSDLLFYLNGSRTASGRTGAMNKIPLTYGTHEILFTKEGYNPKRITVKVTPDGTEKIYVTLTRNVRFFARDASDPGENEIGATITRIYRQDQSFVRKEQTPCEIALAPLNYRVLVQKQGYMDEIVAVPPDARDIIVNLQKAEANVQVVVYDALTGLPLKSAQILVEGGSEGEYQFGITNEGGKCANYITPGQYTFKAVREGYFEKSTPINTNDTRNIEFKLIIN